jgi:hypothetical protein
MTSHLALMLSIWPSLYWCLLTSLAVVYVCRSTGVEYLNYVATSPVFKPWELTDAKARLKLDLDVYNSTLSAR